MILANKRFYCLGRSTTLSDILCAATLAFLLKSRPICLYLTYLPTSSAMFLSWQMEREPSLSMSRSLSWTPLPLNLLQLLFIMRIASPIRRTTKSLATISAKVWHTLPTIRHSLGGRKDTITPKISSGIEYTEATKFKTSAGINKKKNSTDAEIKKKIAGWKKNYDDKAARALFIKLPKLTHSSKLYLI